MPDARPLPRLAFVGPMLGVHPGWVTSQGEILERSFAAAGYPTRIASDRVNRYERLLHSIRSLIAWRNEVDVVILMVFSGPAFVPVAVLSWLTRFLNLPLVLWLHGGNLPAFAYARPAWVKRVFARAAEIVSPSEYLAEQMKPYGRAAQVIPNVIDLEKYRFRQRGEIEPKLLWMRTFHEVYNPWLALDVLKRVLERRPDACLTMAGQDKGELASTQEYAARIGVEDAVCFAGYLDQAGKDREFSRHDVFLNTNRIDNMPVSLIEAAAYGLPVVATDVGGISYMLEDGVTGLLVPGGAADAMAGAVLRLLEEPALVRRLSENGRRMAEGSAWDAVQRMWEQIFRGVSAG